MELPLFGALLPPPKPPEAVQGLGAGGHPGDVGVTPGGIYAPDGFHWGATGQFHHLSHHGFTTFFRRSTRCLEKCETVPKRYDVAAVCPQDKTKAKYIFI